jgi:hypothetical protein
MRFDGQTRNGSELGKALTDPLGSVSADRVAITEPVCACFLGGKREVGEESIIRTRTVLSVHADRLDAALPGRLYGGDHLADDRISIEPAAKLVLDHLVRGRDGQVVMAQSERECGLNVTGECSAPAGEQHWTERASLRQGEIRSYIRSLVEEEREPDFRLRNTETSKVEVDHRLAELRQAGAGRLHPVAVGHVKNVNRWHGLSSGCPLRLVGSQVSFAARRIWRTHSVVLGL